MDILLRKKQAPAWILLRQLKRTSHDDFSVCSLDTKIIPSWPKSINCLNITAQKIKFSIKDFFSECDQIRSFLRIWSHLLKKSLRENFIFCEVYLENKRSNIPCHISVKKYKWPSSRKEAPEGGYLYVNGCFAGKAYLVIYWSICPDMFCEKGVLKNFGKLAGKYLCLCKRLMFWFKCA